MGFDSYETPSAESLLRAAAERRADARCSRDRMVSEAVAAAVFLTGAGLLAALSPWTRSSSLTALLVTVLAYLVASRVRFPVGSAWTAPTQLVFVPMLFMLPVPLVPLLVAACSVLGLWPCVLRRRLTATRVYERVADSFYSLGPAIVLVLAGEPSLSWGLWPVLVLAFGAQVVCDATAGLTRTWFAERIGPSDQWQMTWLYLTDWCFSCSGLMIAVLAVRHPGVVLLVLPLIGWLSLFARERRYRLDYTLALSDAYHGTAVLLGDVVGAVDHYTGQHSREVVEISLAVAGALGLDATAQRDVEFTARLHDVGKIRVALEIVNKPGSLDPAEWEIIRHHTVDGETMLNQVGGTLSRIGRFVRSSHERYDGTGYPDGLAGEAIPIESRIVSACDAYNAMTTDRSYRAARPVSEALAELRRCAGSQFDAQVIAAIDDELIGRTTCPSGFKTERI
jgi:HD-GYP domain-containing protein (c-di-GMP phosphodiesterase class II)